MKRLIYTLFLASAALCAGCTKGDDPAPSGPRVPTASEYKALLEKRAASVDGANINVRQEVSRFENASDTEKLDLYSRVQSLVR